MTFENVAWEQNVDQTGWFFWLVHNSGIQDLSFKQCYGGSAGHGWHLRGIPLSAVVLDTCWYIGWLGNTPIAGVFPGTSLDVDGANVVGVDIRSCFLKGDHSNPNVILAPNMDTTMFVLDYGGLGVPGQSAVFGSTLLGIAPAVTIQGQVFGPPSGGSAIQAFHPLLRGTTSGMAQDHTYTTQIGHLVKTGNLVFFSIILQINAFNALVTGGAYIELHGVPADPFFPTSNLAGEFVSVSIGNYTNFTFNGAHTQLLANMPANNTSIIFREGGSNLPEFVTQVSQFAAGSLIEIAGVYMTGT
jgi:hypothetical protein